MPALVFIFQQGETRTPVLHSLSWGTSKASLFTEEPCPQKVLMNQIIVEGRFFLSILLLLVWIRASKMQLGNPYLHVYFRFDQESARIPTKTVSGSTLTSQKLLWNKTLTSREETATALLSSRNQTWSWDETRQDQADSTRQSMTLYVHVTGIYLSSTLQCWIRGKWLDQ